MYKPYGAPLLLYPIADSYEITTCTIILMDSGKLSGFKSLKKCISYRFNNINITQNISFYKFEFFVYLRFVFVMLNIMIILIKNTSDQFPHILNLPEKPRTIFLVTNVYLFSRMTSMFIFVKSKLLVL